MMQRGFHSCFCARRSRRRGGRGLCAARRGWAIGARHDRARHRDAAGRRHHGALAVALRCTFFVAAAAVPLVARAAAARRLISASAATAHRAHQGRTRAPRAGNAGPRFAMLAGGSPRSGATRGHTNRPRTGRSEPPLFLCSVVFGAHVGGLSCAKHAARECTRQQSATSTQAGVRAQMNIDVCQPTPLAVPPSAGSEAGVSEDCKRQTSRRRRCVEPAACWGTSARASCKKPWDTACARGTHLLGASGIRASINMAAPCALRATTLLPHARAACALARRASACGVTRRPSPSRACVAAAASSTDAAAPAPRERFGFAVMRKGAPLEKWSFKEESPLGDTEVDIRVTVRLSARRASSACAA